MRVTFPFLLSTASALLPQWPLPDRVANKPQTYFVARTSFTNRMSETSDDGSFEKIVEQVSKNMNEGELSTRGEGWFVGQVSLLIGILFAPPEPVAPMVELVVGLSAVASAIVLGAAAVNDLSFGNLTPWPKPVEGNELKTEGVYSLCRHPMYSSLLCGSFGLSLVTLSFERLLLTVALFALVSFKAGREEAFLNDKHGERYRAYSAYVPQFFPTVGAIQDYLRND